MLLMDELIRETQLEPNYVSGGGAVGVDWLWEFDCGYDLVGTTGECHVYLPETGEPVVTLIYQGHDGWFSLAAPAVATAAAESVLLGDSRDCRWGLVVTEPVTGKRAELIATAFSDFVLTRTV